MLRERIITKLKPDQYLEDRADPLQYLVIVELRFVVKGFGKRQLAKAYKIDSAKSCKPFSNKRTNKTFSSTMKLSFVAIFAFLAVAVGNCIAASPVPGYETHAEGSDAALDHRSLRKKKARNVKPFNHVRLEEVVVQLSGPGDYSSPSDEEIRFFTDALMTSFEQTDGEFGYEAGMTILETIKPIEDDEDGSGDGRKLMAFWDSESFLGVLVADMIHKNAIRSLTRSSFIVTVEWFYLIDARCRFCPSGWDDDDVPWIDDTRIRKRNEKRRKKGKKRHLDEDQGPAHQRALGQVLDDKGQRSLRALPLGCCVLAERHAKGLSSLDIRRLLSRAPASTVGNLAIEWTVAGGHSSMVIPKIYVAACFDYSGPRR
eukprot:scaffold35682_cov153-Amphora_coffeaeformis.AAC.1